MTNTNNIKMTGIHEASDLTNYASSKLGQFVSVYYHPNTGDVLALLHSRSFQPAKLEKTGCIYIDSYDGPCTTQQLADNVRGTLDFLNT